jgi:hypothetical protein
MNLYLDNGAHIDKRELTGPRQLRQAVHIMRATNPGHPLQCRAMMGLDRRRYFRIKTPDNSMAIVRAATLALFLAITQIPAGCSLTGHTSEGFPVASCADGSQVYADMDGAEGYNSGLPYVIPGTWVELP